MTKQKLDLVQFTSGIATQAGASPTKVMWCQILNGCSLGAVLNDMPHDAFRYARSPGFACATHAPKHAAFAHAGGPKPAIDGGLDPVRDGHRSNVPTLPDQINHGPVILPSL